jgi:uncharacterized membrane protein YeaQ/YmgE (transglycosylase-associated protein family)
MRSALSLALGPKSVRRIPLALTLCSLCAINAYGWSSVSLSDPSTRQKEKTMSFVVWVVLGLAAGFVGSRLVNKREQGVPADVWVGVAGAVAAGWLFYAFGPPGQNGFNLFSDFAAVIGSLVFLLTYNAIRRD